MVNKARVWLGLILTIPVYSLGHAAMVLASPSGSAEGSLKLLLIHELIHAAGAPGKDPGWWGYLGYDDLSYMQKQYKKITEACN